MATKTKAKPTAASKKTSAKSTTKKAPAKKAPAKKAEKQAKPQTADLLAAETLVVFTGYRGQLAEDEAVFTESEQLYIVSVDEEEDGVMYSCIRGADVAEYLENGEENVEGGQVAPSEVRALKGNALEKARDHFMPVPVFGELAELLDKNGGDAIDAAEELYQNIQENYFWMGGALAKILKDGSYLTENGGNFSGDEAFNDFCQETFGFKASKARSLARIYSTFSSLPNFDPKALAGLGWSKASKAEKYITPENVEDVLDAASDEGVTQRNIDAILKEKFVSENKTASGRQATRGGDKLVMKTITLKLAEVSAETVELVLQSCMKQYGIEDMSLAAERIFTEWAQENLEGKSAKQKIGAKARKAAKEREARAKK